MSNLTQGGQTQIHFYQKKNTLNQRQKLLQSRVIILYSDIF
jgi:hypothetical protein